MHCSSINYTPNRNQIGCLHTCLHTHVHVVDCVISCCVQVFENVILLHMYIYLHVI